MISNMIDELHSAGCLKRYSHDKSITNSHGKMLIELWKSTGMLIVNGRIGNDKGIGASTRVDTTGSSVVDYVIVTPRLFKEIIGFTIGPKFPESDHLPLAMTLKGKSTNLVHRKQILKDWKPQTKFI